MKIYKPQDLFDFGKYKDVKCDFIYTFHPEYIEWLMINNKAFCINIVDFSLLHVFPIAQQFNSNSKYYNLVEILEYDDEYDAMGTTSISLKQFIIEYNNDIYLKHYINEPSIKNTFLFSDIAVNTNNAKLKLVDMFN